MSQRAGWYDDPENPENLRYFDGVLWTTHTTPRTSPTAGQTTIGLAEQKAAQQAAQHAPTQPAPTPSAATQEVPQAPTQQLPYGGRQQDSSGYGQPPQYGQQPPSGQPAPYGQQQPYGPQQPYGQYQQAPQYGPPGYPPQGAYNQMPPAYATALGVKTTPDGVPLASYGQRVGAWFIDFVIQLAITAVAGWYWLSQLVNWYSNLVAEVMNQMEGGGSSPALDQAQLSQEISGLVTAITLVLILVGVVYQVTFLAWKGATPGKLAVGISVRLRETPGNPSVLVALKRQVFYIAVMLLGLVPLIGLMSVMVWILNKLWPLWDDKRQTLHDKIAKTNVVVKRRGR